MNFLLRSHEYSITYMFLLVLTQKTYLAALQGLRCNYLW